MTLLSERRRRTHRRRPAPAATGIAAELARPRRPALRRRAALPAARLGRQRGGPHGTPRRDPALPRTPCAGCCGHPASSAWRRRTSPASSTSRATCRRRSRASGRRSARSAARQRPPADARTADARLPRRAAARRHRPAAAGPGVAGTTARTAAHQAARPVGHRAPLRPVERLLRARARPAHGVLVRLLDERRARVRPRRRPARQARPGLPQARPAARSAPARRRLRLGFAVAARRRPLRGDASPASRSRGSSRRSRRSGRPTRGSATGSTSGCRTTATSSDGPYDAVVSLEMGEHVGAGQLPEYAAQLFRQLKPEGRLVLQQMSRARTAPRRRRLHRVVHRPRHAHASGGPDGRPARGRRVRGARRPCAARALRTHGGRLVRDLRAALGRGGRARRRRGRPRVAALFRRRRARVRGGSHGRGPDPRGEARARRARAACRRPGGPTPASAGFVDPEPFLDGLAGHPGSRRRGPRWRSRSRWRSGAATTASSTSRGGSASPSSR